MRIRRVGRRNTTDYLNPRDSPFPREALHKRQEYEILCLNLASREENDMLHHYTFYHGARAIAEKDFEYEGIIIHEFIPRIKEEQPIRAVIVIAL